MIDNLFIFDCEVYKYNWLFIFKDAYSGMHFTIWDDPDILRAFMHMNPIICGYNNKHYDQFILKSALLGFSPQEIKGISDYIIVHEIPGWQIPALRNCPIHFEQFDLMDDTQKGTSLKDIEGHLGLPIVESTVPFDIDRPLTFEEKREVELYCANDVFATNILFFLRQVYVENKLTLGKEKGLTPPEALYMTNAKLTAIYLEARKKNHADEREYVFPDDILWEYIPAQVREFFEQIHDHSIPDEELWKRKTELKVGECATTIGWGGIHGAIPTYREETTDTRIVRNADVGSYYPHLMTLNGYASRNIPSVDTYKAMLERRMRAKKEGDKSLANALKLVANTTYGAMLNQFNDLCDPLMGRSVCITGQLRLLELAEHLLAECPTLKVVQLNTDGIMCSFDKTDEPKWNEILDEWQSRTGFTLEEDDIQMICQKDVNNYIEVPLKGEPKIKGGALVRGLVTNGNIDFDKFNLPHWTNLMGGAFKINNNAVIISKAIVDYIVKGIPVEETVNASTDILEFQIIAKTWAKCGNAFHNEFGWMVEQQRVNRVYATDRLEFGTLYMIDPDTNNYRKVSGIPDNVLVDNANALSIEDVDRTWYILEAKRLINEFLGVKKRKNSALTKKRNAMKKEALKLL